MKAPAHSGERTTGGAACWGASGYNLFMRPPKTIQTSTLHVLAGLHVCETLGLRAGGFVRSETSARRGACRCETLQPATHRRRARDSTPVRTGESPVSRGVRWFRSMAASRSWCAVVAGGSVMGGPRLFFARRSPLLAETTLETGLSRGRVGHISTIPTDGRKV